MTNYLRVSTDKDNKLITISSFINDVEVSWIEYDKNQIKVLIELLKQAESEINDNL